MRGSRRSLLRRASVLFVVGCSGVATATALAAGPAPDPAPARTTTSPRPEPVTGARPAPRTTSTPKVTVQPQAVRPSPPQPVAPPPALQRIQPVLVQPPPASSFAPPPPARVQTRTAKEKTARARVSTPKRAKQPSPARSVVKATGPSAPDSTLMIGGLALVVLVLGDTIFLALSTRFLRLS